MSAMRIYSQTGRSRIAGGYGTLIPPPEPTRASRDMTTVAYEVSPDAVPALVRDLHRSLDVSDVIGTFLAACEKIAPFDGYAYENTERGVMLLGGKKSPHACNWRLQADDELLGELTLTRDARFTPEETRRIEALLSLLGQPLRNALRYHAALSLSQHDGLTGLVNRAGFESTLARELKLARRNHTPLSLVFMDIDHFKAINDTHGHTAGDQILRAVSEVIARCVRATDVLARFGGEEFVVIQPGADETGGTRLGERVIKAVRAAEFHARRKRVPLTISIGVATYDGREDEKKFLRRADQAMYRAKNEGRDRLCVA